MFNNNYKTVTEILSALEKGDTSSVNLVNHYLANIDRHNGKVNAITQLDMKRALEQAEKADHKRSSGEKLGALHGVPCTIKDSFNVSGLITCSGAPHLKSNVSLSDAPLVERLRDAGAIIIGKTNVPMFTADWQTYNSVYGTTNNPWDLRLTPGGSSGGAAAALAADMIPFEVGSDIGGCLRIPAHYCGVYGHRSSFGLLSVRGHVPGSSSDTEEPDLAAAGPMARSADDLKLLMNIVSNPWIDPGYFPDFKSDSLADKQTIKVFAWFDSPGHPVSLEAVAKYNLLLAELERYPKVEITKGIRPDWSHDEILDLCVNVSGRLFHSDDALRRTLGHISSILTRAVKPVFKLPDFVDQFYKGMNGSTAKHQEVDERVKVCTYQVSEFFEKYDLLLSPVSPGLAHPHLQTPMARRQLQVNDQKVHYYEQVAWSALATLFGIPSTVAPIGLTSSGLPCGVQIMSGYFRDDMCIDFARILEKITGGFIPPETIS